MCVVTLENGNKTLCKPLTKQICREVHKYEEIQIWTCVGNIEYDTYCEALAATSYNNTDGFITHVSHKPTTCSSLIQSGIFLSLTLQ